METEIEITLKEDNTSICLRKRTDDAYSLSINRSYLIHDITHDTAERWRWADLERSEMIVLRNALNRMLGE